jgi:predicted nucleotidyltransferase
MTVQDAVRQHRDEIIEIAARHGATNVRVFGSVARGTAGPESDLDLLVDVSDDASPWFPAELLVDLEDLLGIDVDVLTEPTIYWVIRDQVLAEARPL